MPQTYEVTLAIRVTDHRALFQAARDEIEKCGGDRLSVRDIETALRILLDPGSDEERGYVIDDSTCEAV